MSLMEIDTEDSDMSDDEVTEESTREDSNKTNYAGETEDVDVEVEENNLENTNTSQHLRNSNLVVEIEDQPTSAESELRLKQIHDQQELQRIMRVGHLHMNAWPVFKQQCWEDMINHQEMETSIVFCLSEDITTSSSLPRNPPPRLGEFVPAISSGSRNQEPRSQQPRSGKRYKKLLNDLKDKMGLRNISAEYWTEEQTNTWSEAKKALQLETESSATVCNNEVSNASHQDAHPERVAIKQSKSSKPAQHPEVQALNRTHSQEHRAWREKRGYGGGQKIQKEDKASWKGLMARQKAESRKLISLLTNDFERTSEPTENAELDGGDKAEVGSVLGKRGRGSGPSQLDRPAKVAKKN